MLTQRTSFRTERPIPVAAYSSSGCGIACPLRVEYSPPLAAESDLSAEDSAVPAEGASELLFRPSSS